MKFINISYANSREEVLETIKNCQSVNENVHFDDKLGRPIIKVFEKKEKLKITCEMVGGPSKDNGFLVGTFFKGKLVRKNGETVLKGIILTAPIYHLFMVALTAFFIYRCITLKGINFIPIILIIMSYFLFKNEYKKQGILDRYFMRVKRFLEEKKTKN